MPPQVLERLLEEIRRDGVASTTGLAVRLGESVALVEAMLSHLARAGYLEAVEGGEAGCAGGCPGCSATQVCRPDMGRPGVGRWKLSRP